MKSLGLWNNTRNVKITEQKRISKKEKIKEEEEEEREKENRKIPGINKNSLQRMGLGVQQSRLES